MNSVPNTNSTMITTYSMWSLFRNCRKACEYRYFWNLVPVERAHTLMFGSLVHNCLELWHGTRDLAKVLDYIDRQFPDRAREAKDLKDWHLANAMMKGYAARYPEEDFEIVALEKSFQGPIVNPATGEDSSEFVLSGKVDGIVQIDGEYFLMENKTAASVDASYLERLWTDFQITLYAWYVEQTMGLHISGILYNILVKAKLNQKMGETEAEYDARRSALIAKSKTGCTSAKRKMTESDGEFQARLGAKYAEPEMFHRETLYLSRDRFDELRAELWELTRALQDARVRNTFYRNSAYCFQYHRPCAYYPICSSGENPMVIENQYEIKEPHEELKERPVAAEAAVF